MNKKGVVAFEILDEYLNGYTYIGFLMKLKKKCYGKKIAIVQDNLRAHLTIEAQEYCKMNNWLMI